MLIVKGATHMSVAGRECTETSGVNRRPPGNIRSSPSQGLAPSGAPVCRLRFAPSAAAGSRGGGGCRPDQPTGWWKQRGAEAPARTGTCVPPWNATFVAAMALLKSRGEKSGQTYHHLFSPQLNSISQLSTLLCVAKLFKCALKILLILRSLPLSSY